MNGDDDELGNYASSYRHGPSRDRVQERIAGMAAAEAERQRRARAHTSAGYADIVRRTNERFDAVLNKAPLDERLRLRDAE